MELLLSVFVIWLAYRLVSDLRTGRGKVGDAAHRTVRAVVLALGKLCRLVGNWCRYTEDWLGKYADEVESHRNQVLTPFIGEWMLGTLEDRPCTPDERRAYHAAHDVINKVGLRDRNPASVEAIGRHVRAKLLELTMEPCDVSYWGEVCTQMYFNPPYEVRAASTRLPGFR